MASKKNPEGLITKKVKFQGKDMTLFSLDGVTWSSRADELKTIQDRHSTEQAGFSSDLKGEEKEKSKFSIKPKRPMFQKAARPDDDEDMVDDEIEEDIGDEEGDEDKYGDEESDTPTKSAKGKAGAKVPAIKEKPMKGKIPAKPIKPSVSAKVAKKPLPKAKVKPVAKKPAPKAKIPAKKKKK